MTIKFDSKGVSSNPLPAVKIYICSKCNHVWPTEAWTLQRFYTDHYEKCKGPEINSEYMFCE